MSRQTFLLGLLLVVAALGLPVVAMDQTLGKVEQEMEQVQAELAPLQVRLARLREREQVIARYDAVRRAAHQRLLQGDPYIAARAHIAMAAAQAGVTTGTFEVTGPHPVPELEWLARYDVILSVRGTPEQYAAFLQILEEHPLLIRLPDVAVRFPPESPDQVQTTLQLSFFGPAPQP